MKSVKIGELKNHLSAYLKDVQRGEEVIVCDNNKPVARILPFPKATAGSYEAERQELIARGVLRPRQNTEPMDWVAFDALPGPVVSAEDAKEAIDWAKGER